MKYYIEIDADLDADTKDSVLEWLERYQVNCRYVEPSEVFGQELDAMQEVVESQAREIDVIIENVDELQGELEDAIDRGDNLEDELDEVELPSSRRPPVHFKLPSERDSLTHKFRVGGSVVAEGYVTVGTYPDSADVGEIFVTMNPFNASRQPQKIEELEERLSELYAFQKGIVDQLALAVSVGLQRGIPLAVYVNKFIHTKFPPFGFTQNPDIPRASSVIDYIFRWIGGIYIDSDKYMPRRRERLEQKLRAAE